jgi:hypothetical protein
MAQAPAGWYSDPSGAPGQVRRCLAAGLSGARRLPEIIVRVALFATCAPEATSCAKCCRSGRAGHVGRHKLTLVESLTGPTGLTERQCGCVVAWPARAKRVGLTPMIAFRRRCSR